MVRLCVRWGCRRVVCECPQSRAPPKAHISWRWCFIRKKKFPSSPDLMWNKLVFLSSKLSGFLKKSC